MSKLKVLKAIAYVLIGLNFYTLNVFASEEIHTVNYITPYSPEFSIDLNSIDINQSYVIRESFVDKNGNTNYIEHTFTPNPNIEERMSVISQNQGNVGTWTSNRYVLTKSMSYTFDVGRSGDQWTISNARNHTYSNIFTNFSNNSLRISRGTSTNQFPAEINASVQAEIFNNGWVGPLISETWLMSTTVNNNGWMVLRAN